MSKFRIHARSGPLLYTGMQSGLSLADDIGRGPLTLDRLTFFFAHTLTIKNIEDAAKRTLGLWQNQLPVVVNTLTVKKLVIAVNNISRRVINAAVDAAVMLLAVFGKTLVIEKIRVHNIHAGWGIPVRDSEAAARAAERLHELLGREHTMSERAVMAAPDYEMTEPKLAPILHDKYGRSYHWVHGHPTYIQGTHKMHPAYAAHGRGHK